LDSTGQPGHGDVVGSSDAPTPQHPSMSHIPMRIFSSSSMAQRTETPGAHETPPPHMLDHAHDGLHGESHEDDSTGIVILEHHMLKAWEQSPSSFWWMITWFP
jgi:hypothetical protein